MKTIKNDLKNGLENFIESFRDSNDDVTKYGSEKTINAITNEKNNHYGYSSKKVSNRKITSYGVE